MSILSKLPLLNSDSKIVRAVGYFVYPLLFLIILGAMAPPEDEQTATTTKTTTGETDLADFVAKETSQWDPENITIIGGDVHILLPFSESRINSWRLFDARMESTNIFRRLFQDERIKSVEVRSQIRLRDKFGNKWLTTGAVYNMTSTTAKKINWDNFYDAEDLDDVVDSKYIHYLLREEEEED